MYRPDIDGLRAIAVLSVVAFHAFPTRLKGGFVGVDVFFVISGYLISTIIFENLINGTFRFSDFYARRIKRIFPALFLVLAACYFFGWYVLLADEYMQLGKHIVAGSGFVSNFVLWNEAGYFDNSAETKPLLHLWSLGIEEQFYIIWPLLLWFTWKRKLHFIYVIIIITLVSFYLNIKGITKNIIYTFYSPQTRFWELLSGSLLAWFTLYNKGIFSHIKKTGNLVSFTAYHLKLAQTNKYVSNIISAIGLALIVYSIISFDKGLNFPGYWATLPVIGSVLIISSEHNAWINRIILSNRLVVIIGLISYPLYLLHWPLLSFARIIESGSPSSKVRIVAVILSVILAWTIYMLVERPIRSSKNSKVITLALVCFLFSAGYIGYETYNRDGLGFRSAVKTNKTAALSGSDGADGNNSVNDCGLEGESKGLFGVCAKDKRGNVKYALLGDSKAAALYPGLVRTSNDHGRWLFIGGNGPNGAPIPLISPEPEFSSFQKLTTTAVDVIANNDDIETVVIVTAIRAIFLISDGVHNSNIKTYNYKYLSNLQHTTIYDKTFEGLHKTISILAQARKKVVIVVDNPALPESRDCAGRKTSVDMINVMLKLDNRQKEDCFVSLSKFNDETRVYRDLLDRLKGSFPTSVEIFDTTDLYCDKSRDVCEPTHNGRLLYSYTDHISDYAAGLVGTKLNAFLNR